MAKARKLQRASRPVAKQAPQVSPLAPAGGFPDLPPIAGLRLAAAKAGVRYRGRLDVMLAVLDPGTVMAGVTTRSATRSAPVLDCEDKLSAPDDGTAPAAIIVNSGNSNAFTGSNGREAVRAIAKAVSTATGVPERRVFSSSTGVIGEALPYDRIVKALDGLAADLAPDALELGARAIMTTDTFPKACGVTLSLGGEDVHIAGIAKGSGMIAPDMATMLVYIFTDAKIAQPVLQGMLSELTNRTFNCITVDSDTSTSDTLLLAATGKVGPQIEAGGDDYSRFRDALHGVMRDLSHQVVRDGEGATKFLEVRVTGAASDAEAKTVAMAIANSPLVKTAVAGEDPNWGRVVMAVGKSGAAADRDRLSIWFGDHIVAENGWVSPSYNEATGADYMKASDLLLRVDLGLGAGTATVWTCDLTHAYITINADYRS
ncbi:bifunctional glutamate N-acetyltransferase/amino-acid acetyltransferase ArgJ [Pseudoruegeria sp. SK021]|uniref:bifunctional glutamate N-acetyltransferase/amino-acid acetyltransferase ArgJ n=1 Tax=Pseudoruegeria sp. SK021 TaxID=1933035 RepID=UPI000A22A86D|nr:bifunctional glutamate N-acetyltransferase/amino-acid acetyltransferase ArgJ [Pseudoruegeria sp. SK021]OSP54672.1 bifunctional ornithine acetyltransferase/N-acetylglutamate synthase [Pseudoruegeria sp. SK021]